MAWTEKAIEIGRAALDVSAEMAPYLLLGFFVAGLLSVWIRPEWVERQLGDKGFLSVLKSALFGVPMPLCSCGVIPVTASIRRHGASKGATAAFLISTPQTGIDSIFATYSLLGWVYAIYRPIVALITGVVGGLLVSLFDHGKESDDPAPTAPSCTSSCCESSTTADTAPSRLARLVQAMRYGFITLPRDIALSLIIGILIAALITAFIGEGALTAYLGGGILAMFIMMLVGLPLYVCSTASIPIALGFMHMGASPGAALVFLITGPATNAATISVMWKLLGRRTVLIYLGTVAAFALLSGFGLDAIYDSLDAQGWIRTGSGHEHAGSPGWFDYLCAAALFGILAFSHLSHRRSGEDDDIAGEQHLRLTITGMRCMSCVKTIQRALEERPEVVHASVDLDQNVAIIHGLDLDPEALCAAISELGYFATVADA